MRGQSSPTLDEVREVLLPVLLRHGIKRAGLFGSLVRGELRPRSDVDLAVEIMAPMSLFDFVGLKLELEEALGRKVDLVEYDAIKPRIRDHVLSEHVPIL
jgi:predicted nucleotidyltransferase